MNPRSMSLDSQCHLTRFRHLPPGPSPLPAAALHQASNRQYLDRLINIFGRPDSPEAAMKQQAVHYFVAAADEKGRCATGSGQARYLN